MIKRIFDIVTFPFYFIYLLISFPFKILKIIIDDKIEKRSHKNIKSSLKTNDKEFIDIGTILFPEQKIDFESYYNTFLNDKKRFLTENEELLKDYENFEFDKLKPLEILFIFGDSKSQLLLTDWRGEENEREIENFIERKLRIETDWKNVNGIRKCVDEESQRDGEFLIDLLKTIDKDLEPLNKRLIFLELGWDSYVYTVVDQHSYKTIIHKFGKLFYGTEKLRK